MWREKKSLRRKLEEVKSKEKNSMTAELIIKNYRCFEDTQPLHFVLEKGFTAFVGPNNAGKSSVLRFFYEFRNLWTVLLNKEELSKALRGISSTFNLKGIEDYEEVFCNLNPRNEIQIEIKLSPPKGEETRSVTNLALYITRTINEVNKVNVATDCWVNERKINLTSHTFYTEPAYKWDGEVVVETETKEKPISDFTNVFALFRILEKCMYIASFRNIVNLGGQIDYFDIKIGTDFVQAWRTWKAGPIKKQQRKIQKVSQHIKEIFKLKSLDINDAQTQATLQITLNGTIYKLNELGAGIAQFIIVLGNAAMWEPTFILIDEPELHLHPTLQLDFLMALGSYAREGVIFATHSIGLARSVAEKIYSVRQDEAGRALIRNFEETPHLAEFLGELSFRSFKELGFDKILLVEGVNDLKAIRQLLLKFNKDSKIVLLPLGGSQMINTDREFELSEIQRISENLSVLIDSEKDAKDTPLLKERQGFVDACSRLGIHTHVLERRAIENYLTEKAIQEVKGPKYRALRPYEKLKEANPHWAKPENWQIAEKMPLDDIRHTDLGEFLSKL